MIDESELKACVGQHCTVEYDITTRLGRGFGLVDGIVIGLKGEKLAVVYRGGVKEVSCSAITDIKTVPCYDLERHGLRMSNVVGDTPQERYEGRVRVVRSWIEAAQKAERADVAVWLEDVVSQMEKLSWLAPLA